MRIAWEMLAALMLLSIIVVIGLKAAACPPLPPPPPPPPNCGAQVPICICDDQGRCFWVWTCQLAYRPGFPPGIDFLPRIYGRGLDR